MSFLSSKKMIKHCLLETIQYPNINIVIYIEARNKQKTYFHWKFILFKNLSWKLSKQFYIKHAITQFSKNAFQKNTNHEKFQLLDCYSFFRLNILDYKSFPEKTLKIINFFCRKTSLITLNFFLVKHPWLLKFFRENTRAYSSFSGKTSLMATAIFAPSKM